MTGIRNCHKLSLGGDPGLMVQARGAAGAATWLRHSPFRLHHLPSETPEPRPRFGSCVQVYAGAFHLLLLGVIKAPENSLISV